MQYTFRLLFVLAILAAGSAGRGHAAHHAAPPAEAPALARGDLDLLEAVFRYQFKNNASAKRKATEYFLLVRDKDAPAELLKRFADHRPPVAPGTEYVRRGRDGIRFHIKEWEADGDSVYVLVEYDAGALNAAGDAYKLQRMDGRWVVVRRFPRWIS